MLSAADNERLTRVGAGTPMGAMLRRYWLPACLAEEVPVADGAPVRVRLLGVGQGRATGGRRRYQQELFTRHIDSLSPPRRRDAEKNRIWEPLPRLPPLSPSAEQAEDAETDSLSKTRRLCVSAVNPRLKGQNLFPHRIEIDPPLLHVRNVPQVRSLRRTVPD